MFLRLYVKKINRTFDIGESTELPQISQDYLMQYGVDQSGTDSHASLVHPDSKAKDGTPAKNAFEGTVAEYQAKVAETAEDWVKRIQTGQVKAKVVEDPKVTMRRELAKELGVELTDDVMEVLKAAVAKKAQKKAA